MTQLATLLSAIASLAWPIIFAALLIAFTNPLKDLVKSARQRKFTIKVAGNELSMEEATEIQRHIVADLQSKLADLERRLGPVPSATSAATIDRHARRILWVDDRPKNNSYLVALLEEQGASVDTALSTDDAVAMFSAHRYDIVLSDMGRPEGDKAGLDLAKKIRALNPTVPFYIFCGSWAAHHLRDEALAVGVSGITSSGTTLLSQLPLGGGLSNS